MEYKTAIVHEWLTVFAGAEKVLEEIYNIYPSPIYTLLADKNTVKNSIFKDAEISTSFIQNLPFAKKKIQVIPSFIPPCN